MILLVAALLAQTPAPTVIADPSVASRKANVDSCASGTKTCLDVKVVEGGTAGSSSGGGTIDGGDVNVHGSLLVYVVDAGPPLNINPPISLPLPTGAATEATLQTLVSSGTFSARLGVLGQALMSGSTPVVIASDQTPVSVSQSGSWSAAQPDGGVPASEATLAASAQDVGQLRQLLEQLVLLTQQQVLAVQSLKDPGR